MWLFPFDQPSVRAKKVATPRGGRRGSETAATDALEVGNGCATNQQAHQEPRRAAAYTVEFDTRTLCHFRMLPESIPRLAATVCVRPRSAKNARGAELLHV
jgi:hypothetical protein